MSSTQQCKPGTAANADLHFPCTQLASVLKIAPLRTPIGVLMPVRRNKGDEFKFKLLARPNEVADVSC